tara:strand:+ start:413 stop:1936 length:1524 start_codon:yes stop_codon:yes gene_type:complete
MVIRKLIIPLNLPRSYVEINGSHNSHINIVYDIINCNKSNEKSIIISFQKHFIQKISLDKIESLNIFLEQIIPIIFLSKDIHQGLYQLLRFLDRVTINLIFTNNLFKKQFAFHNLSKILSFSGYLINFISEDVKLLDILDPNFASRLNGNITFYKIVFDKIDPDLYDQETLLDLLRKTHRFLKFQILFGLIQGDIDIIRFAKELSLLAQATLDKTIDIVEKEIQKKYNIELDEYCIIAYGRFASLNMSSNSDLDLVFIYSDNVKAKESDSIPYTDLFHKLINILSTKTNEGILYEVDTKLSPSRKIGSIASTFSNFKNYQKNNAFSWERIALKKTRIVSKENIFSSQLSNLIKDLNSFPISCHELAKEINLMRIGSDHIGNNNDNTKKNQPSKWFETKYTAGGQRDIEFLRFFYNDKSHFKIAHEIEKKMIFLKNMETLFFKIDQIMNICFLNEKQDDLTFKAITLLISETNEKDLGSLKANVNNGKVEIFNTLNKILLHHDHIDIT